jgi:hypothetical protein
MSAASDRLTEADLRELARMVRVIHARSVARHERLRQDAASQGAAPGGGRDAA